MRRRDSLALVVLLVVVGFYAYQTYFIVPTLEPEYTFQVVNKYPHDPTAFTQGLVYHEGILYEGTGLRGQSTLRKTELTTGEIIESISLAPEYFGEGITIHENQIYQLTWQSHTAYTYDLELNQIATWSIPDEGWGLTTNGEHLIMSDGTSTLSIIDPQTYTITDTITVTSQDQEISHINELEYIQGYIYANIWQTDQIAIINPTTGEVESWIDLTGLQTHLDTTTGIDVLNGIAYDPETQRIFVTGKLWPNLFEIKLTPK